MSDLVISIVSTDDRDALDRCLAGIFSSIGKAVSFEVFIVDNMNGIAEFVRGRYPQVKVVVNTTAKGFSENHNNIIRRTSSKYIMIMNPDVIIQNNYVEGLIGTMNADMRIGCVAGKLLLGVPGPGKKMIDSAGIAIYRSRRAVDRGQGEEDLGQYDEQEEVFSLCSAAVLCRRGMLEDIKLLGEYYDGSFYIYKEDIDLCWRARIRGWKCVYDPKAVAYHARGWAKGTKRGKIPKNIREHSYKNRYLLMIKNDSYLNIIKDMPLILWYEIKTFIFIILREPFLLLAWIKIISLLPLSLRKRHQIMKNAIVSPNEVRKWFV